MLDSGWATARVAPTGASSPSCSGVGATLVVAHGRRLSSPTLVVAHACRRPRYRARRARRRPCRFPDGLVWVGTGRRKGVARHLVRRKRSRAGFGMGDRAPSGRDRVAGWATARVAGWATARVAPTGASSPSCSGVGATLVVAHACRRPRYRARRARRRPCRFPDGLVWVGTGRRKGVARHLVRRKRSRAGFGMGHRAPSGRDRVGMGDRKGRGMGDRKGRPYGGLVAELFGCRGDACRRPRLNGSDSETRSQSETRPSLLRESLLVGVAGDGDAVGRLVAVGMEDAQSDGCPADRPKRFPASSAVVTFIRRSSSSRQRKGRKL